LDARQNYLVSASRVEDGRQGRILWLHATWGGGNAMAIKLPDAMITFTGEEQYVLALILQSAKRQMENWKQKRRPDIARHYQVVCSLLRKIDPENPPKGATP